MIENFERVQSLIRSMITFSGSPTCSRRNQIQIHYRYNGQGGPWRGSIRFVQRITTENVAIRSWRSCYAASLWARLRLLARTISLIWKWSSRFALGMVIACTAWTAVKNEIFQPFQSACDHWSLITVINPFNELPLVYKRLFNNNNNLQSI